MSQWTGNKTVFRTYFHGKVDKDGTTSPAEKVKGMPGHAWNEVCNDNSFGAVLNDGYVDISFDSDELSQAFWDMAEQNDWKCLILENPENGHIHSYWKKPEGVFQKDGRDKKLAVGLIADIHSKETYIRLRTNGVDRFPPSFEPDEIQEVPEELYPVDSNIDLWKMEAGDGRNDELFKYILVLQTKLTFDKEIIRRILKNTNDFIFAEPLDEHEFKTITRDGAFEKPIFFTAKGGFLFDKFGNYLIHQHNMIKLDGQLHVYHQGTYTNNKNIIAAVIRSYIPNIKKSQKTEVLEYLVDMCPAGKEADANYIAFRNGIYDIAHDELLPFSSDFIVTNRIDYDYNPAAYSELADKTLDKLACGDADIRALLEECVGYCFYRSCKFKKMFMLTGGGDNGKSTFLDCIKAILGDENVSSLELKDLGEKFRAAQIYRKLANIGDDISDDFLQGSQVSMFKKVVAGNRIVVERKGQDPFEFEPYAKWIASVNDIPRMKDKTGAVLRRLVIIPFNAVFREGMDGFDRDIKYKMLRSDSLEYLVKVGVDALKRMLKSNGFTKSEKVQKESDEYEKYNNPILGFIEEYGEDYIFNETITDVFAAYSLYCRENGLISESANSFGRSMKRMFNVESKNVTIAGKSYRRYVKITES